MSRQKPAHQPWEQWPRGLLQASGKKSRLRVLWVWLRPCLLCSGLQGERTFQGAWTDTRTLSAWRRKTRLPSLEGILDWGRGLGGLGRVGMRAVQSPVGAGLRQEVSLQWD